MGIATPPPPPHLIIGLPKPVSSLQTPTTTSTSMSHGFHHHHHHHQGGIFGFSSDVFDRSTAPSTTTTIPGNAGQHEHVAQQSRREKLRVQEFDPAGAAATGHAQLVPIDDDTGDGDGEGGGQEASMYATAAGGAGHAATGSMLSEMFNFAGGCPSGADFLGYRQLSAMRPAAPPMAAFGTGDWYAGSSNKPQQQQQQQQAMHHHPALTADSAMQLFLMNPPPPPPLLHRHQHTRSPSPPPPPPPPPQPEQHTQTLHHHQALIQAFGDNSAASFGGGQGLSLSLSSSLQQFEMAKAAEELRVRDAAMLYYNQQQQQQQQLHHLQLEGHGQVLGPPQAAQLGFGPAGVAAVLRSSKYARAAQELLEEFCSVGRGQFRSGRIGRGSAANNPNPKSGGNSGASSSAAAAAAASTSSSKEAPPLSPAERFEQQRKKAKLISMLDEVERRYNHYCEQMQMVVNSFDSVMGFGAATPYTALAQKAMSRHFRCLKDAISAQLRQACELLGEKDAGGGSGLTKGETPRLRILDQNLRQQRAFHHMGMMEQEAWRPQRGLPERSVNVLRAWLFEHFLHPYPSDADKHFLARQTGLSRNQVSNWFINARVRLWKPMVEEMYQQEAKDHDDDDEDDEAAAAAAAADAASSLSPPSSSGVGGAPPKSEPHPGGPPAPGPQNAPQAPPQLSTSSAVADMAHAGLYSGRYAAAAAATHALRFGAAGDVSLTLGLRHGAAGSGGSGAGVGGSDGGGGGRFGAVREFGG
ncbi:BEL1-like homeodomain protein 4 [Ananas comosus]|uniref:BEL1-like homeodomain protein 4 n=1 Tax=Ananas comosus TaxID=4615 RepID=A0A6P5EZ64_ANACO|nr:BEL1-like homeodomain protein 4 [Ananas comosus]XP_020089149.1 BEL1-like homeodomain protein 4 [Ananas comosus]XP_020089157.1 BEL1-like homeodomain protein 4 [Ananas comosus]